MAEYLKEISVKDRWNLVLGLVEVNLNSDGEQEFVLFKIEEYSVFHVLSLGHGRIQAGIDSAFRTIKFEEYLKRKEKPEPQMEVAIFPIPESQIIQ